MSDSKSEDSPAPTNDDATGLPGLRSWPAVYVFVLAAFVIYVVMLTVLAWVNAQA